MRLRSSLVIMAGALVALAMWPSLVLHRAPAAVFTPAPVTRDYLLRDRYIAFYERQVREEPSDQIKGRMLAQLYLQRFREQYDLNDVARAERLARRSIVLQPQGNTSAQMTLASALLSYHDFRGALAHERAAWMGEPFNRNARAQIASAEMELGEYTVARKTLDAIADRGPDDPTVDAVRARYYELTGHMDRARTLIARAIKTMDSDVDNPAYDRSWYHMRAAQLAFEANDDATAQAEFDTSLAFFPNNAMALLWEARMYRAQGRWRQALDAAVRSAQLYPLPQVLGYEADAQRALGDAAAARQTDALIDAEQRLFDAQGINDRLLANYYAQRNEHLDAALRAAESDYRKRGDEVYSDDTMAWVLARMGRWSEARPFAERATRLGTEDPQLQYHAGVVAMQTGHLAEAKQRLEKALAENARFDPFEASDAQTRLASLH